MRSVPIKNFLDKFPGGIIIIPLLIGCLLNTFCPSVLQIGSFTTGLATGTSSLMGALFICLGAQLNVKCAPQALKTGFAGVAAAQIAAASIVTCLLTPFLAAWVSKQNAKRALAKKG